jgi:hypothetical protein
MILSLLLSFRLFSSRNHNELTVTPSLVVFDLDDCLWSPEMFTLHEIPNSSDVVYGQLTDDPKDTGVLAVNSGHEQIKLFPGALKVLQRSLTVNAQSIC